MKIQKYSASGTSKRKKTKKLITAIVIIIFIVLAAAFAIGKLTENSAEYQLRASMIEENRALREKTNELEEQLAELEAQLAAKDEYIGTLPTPSPSPDPFATEAPDEPEGPEAEPDTGTTPRDINQ